MALFEAKLFCMTVYLTKKNLLSYSLNICIRQPLSKSNYGRNRWDNSRGLYLLFLCQQTFAQIRHQYNFLRGCSFLYVNFDQQ